MAIPSKPELPRFEIPEAERAAAAQIAKNLMALGRFVETFACTLDLIILSEKLERWTFNKAKKARIHEWGTIALREGALTIYHFAKVWQATPGLLRHCPAIAEHVDRKSLRAVGRAIEADFPHWAAMRKAVAHRGDFSKDEANFFDHASPGGAEILGMKFSGANIMLLDMREGRMYAATVDNQQVRYELTADTHKKLAAIFVAAEEAFGKVISTIVGEFSDKILGSAWLLKPDQIPHQM